MKLFIRVSIAITIIICSLIIISAGAQMPDFSGSWKRNDEKTNAGGLSINSVSVNLLILQDRDSITIKGTNKNGKGEVSDYTDKIKFDGSLAERMTSNGQKKKMKLSWSDDKKQLLQTSTYSDENANIIETIKLIFSLSEDGKTLTVSDDRSFDGQTFHLLDVYERQ